MKILISGGTGFIGSALIASLSETPHDIIILTRGRPRMELKGALTLKYIHWDPSAEGEWMKAVDGCDAVINLIGKNVFEQRWNAAVKNEILSSRMGPTRMLVEAVARSHRPPSLLISASAVGYYGDRGSEVITEVSSGGNDFLADVVRQWESAAYRAEQFGVRVATPRIGLVLERSGGIIGKMLPPFQWFVGGPIGSGDQFLPWVHMDDVVRGIIFPMEQEEFRGVYNLVSPQPVTMNYFAKTFGSVLKRPSWLSVPDLALFVLYGEGAKVILSGQKALPEKLLSAGYEFSFSELSPALRDIVA